MLGVPKYLPADTSQRKSVSYPAALEIFSRLKAGEEESIAVASFNGAPHPTSLQLSFDPGDDGRQCGVGLFGLVAGKLFAAKVGDIFVDGDQIYALIQAFISFAKFFEFTDPDNFQEELVYDLKRAIAVNGIESKVRNNVLEVLYGTPLNSVIRSGK
ncbi:MAG: hypothetical protein ABII07_04780 [Patescibacteria group bacterium]|nr:hypothetical protein [Patescibacteria group bacterium]